MDELWGKIVTSTHPEKQGTYVVAYCPVCQFYTDSIEHGLNEAQATAAATERIKAHLAATHSKPPSRREERL